SAGTDFSGRHCRRRATRVAARAGSMRHRPLSCVLAVQGLRKSFGGVQAVRDVSFTVDAGQMLALIGPNGAGKSTCFNMVGGQVRPDAGQILLAGQPAGARPRAIWRMGV